MTARIAATTARSNDIWVMREEAQHQDRVVQHREDRARATVARYESGRRCRGRCRSSVKNSAHTALSLSSPPTCGPTTSSCTTCTPASTALEGPLEPGADLGRGLLRIGRQADGDVARGAEILHLRVEETGGRQACCATSSTLTACGKLTSAFTPPVKSMARFSPRTKNEASDTTISTADSVYHTLRVAMNGKLVWWLKNSTSDP